MVLGAPPATRRVVRVIPLSALRADGVISGAVPLSALRADGAVPGVVPLSALRADGATPTRPHRHAYLPVYQSVHLMLLY